MNDIKFRAWDKVNGCWLNDIFIDNDGSVWSREDINGYELLHEEFSIDIVEFTGLKDKNGVEIYEGDIVKGDGFYPSEVNYNEDAAAFMFWDLPIADGLAYTVWEVIGNIYENPELLEK